MPEREYVLGSVHVAVVTYTTVTTSPFSYSKSCDTSRPRLRKSSTRRTGLGSVPLINNLKDYACVSAFVGQHSL